MGGCGSDRDHLGSVPWEAEAEMRVSWQRFPGQRGTRSRGGSWAQ